MLFISANSFRPPETIGRSRAVGSAPGPRPPASIIHCRVHNISKVTYDSRREPAVVWLARYAALVVNRVSVRFSITLCIYKSFRTMPKFRRLCRKIGILCWPNASRRLLTTITIGAWTILGTDADGIIRFLLARSL
ncbi:hypothetical protein EVAR_76512_1 [Eumeta japonica]|uniref:Uncharacterized protein n=1 Tax=Eumeta variegata TaxID=151549 RepID=A0A4C1T871_EUMVA|nr:hypothetical protein EVAR_76512_1 [Eumeta japonica]